MIETKSWKDESEIGDLFMNSLGHAYTRNYRARKVANLQQANLRSVDIVSQVRSNHEYEVTDLDHYYEYFGGLMVKGCKSAVYISDTTGVLIETESVEKSINRGIRTRLLNPKWIDAMLEHDYHGVQKIYDRFENIMGLAASTNRVEPWIYDEMFQVYLADDAMRKRLMENNRYAYLSILEQMFEYQNRNYWEPDKEQLELMKQLYLELESNIEGSNNG